jgi:hypothetical protein
MNKKRIFILAMMIVNVVLCIIAAFINNEIAWVLAAILWIGNIATELTQQYYKETIQIQDEIIKNQFELIKKISKTEV